MTKHKKRNRRTRRKPVTASARPALPVRPGDVIDHIASGKLNLKQIEAVANLLKSDKPEEGQRTPPLDINITRQRHSLTDLSISDVASILNRAEDGDTSRMVDLWLHMLKTDAHLLSVWSTRTAPVASANFKLKLPRRKTPTSALLLQACQQGLDNVDDLEKVFSAQLNAIGVGFDAAEIIWDRVPFNGKLAWLPINIKTIHPRRFRFSDKFELGLWDNGAAVQQLKAEGWPVDTITSRGQQLVRLPLGKYIVHQPMGIHDFPTASGLVHPIARWWWVKMIATRYWLQGAELAGNPRLIGKLLQEAPAGVAEELQQGLEDLANDGVIILRPGSEIEIVEGKGLTAADIWDRLFNRMDLAMTKAMLGSTLNTEIDSSGGNRAAAESQGAKTIDPRKKLDGDQMWSAWRKQLFSCIRDYNPHLFPESDPLPHGEFYYEELEEDEKDTQVAAPKAAETPAPDEATNDEAKGEEIEQELEPGASVADPAAALKGAQVTALKDIILSVAAGELPRDTGIALVVAAFPLSKKQAIEIMGSVGTPAFEPEDPIVAATAKKITAAANSVEQYVWRTQGDADVRPSHARLNGSIHRWASPPITNAEGGRNHPGEDFNCRCIAMPLGEG